MVKRLQKLDKRSKLSTKRKLSYFSTFVHANIGKSENHT